MATAIATELFFVVHTAQSYSLYAGKVVCVRNAGPDVPVPDWVVECAHPCPPPASLEGVWIVDARAALEDARAIAEASRPRPRVYLRRPEVRRLLGNISDEGLNEAVGRFGFPPATLVREIEGNDVFERDTGSHERWDEPAVTAWIAFMTTLVSSLHVGDRPTRRT